MRRSGGAAVLAGMGAGVAGAGLGLAKGIVPALRWALSVHDGHDAAASAPTRWRVVTVNRPPDEIAPGGRLPEPLAELGDSIEVQITPAPGDKGTELAARLREGASFSSIGSNGSNGSSGEHTRSDPRRAIRLALRKSKQLLETGEVLSPHRPSTTKRTLSNLPLELASRVAGEEGVL